MECDQVGDTPEHNVKSSPTPFGDMLDKLCAYYMAIGVPCDEFWNGDYTRLKYYEETHRIKTELRNQELWLQGFYFYEAVSIAIGNAFRKKGQPASEYPKEPHRITPLSEDEKEAEKKKIVENFRAQLNAMDKKFSAKHAQQ